MSHTPFIVAALVVLYCTISVIPLLDFHKFEGHPLRFVGLAVYWALAAAGAVCMVVELYSYGGQFLITALALRAITDRRRAS